MFRKILVLTCFVAAIAAPANVHASSSLPEDDELFEDYHDGLDDTLEDAGIPEPIIRNSRERRNRNYNIGKRQDSLPDRYIGTEYGVDMRDVRHYGPAGGPNSEVNKLRKRFGF